MPLPHDSSGFLIGQRMVSSLDAVKEDTAAVLAIIRQQRAAQGADSEESRRALEEVARNTRETREADARDESGGQPADRTVTRRAQEGGSRRRAPAPPPGAGPEPGAVPDQARNERGQFTGDGESDAKKQGWLSKLADAVKGRAGMGADTDNMDPTVTAIHEASQLMAPIAKVGSVLFRAGGWLFGRKKDDVPKEQRRHNKLIEKLLKKISNLRGEGGLGGPILGGFIGGLVERFGPMLAAAVPMLGSLLFKGLGLALAWKGGQAVGAWVYKAFQPQIDAVADAIGGAVETAIGWYKSSVDTVTGWIETVVSGYAKAVQKASEGIEWIADKLGWLKDKGGGAVDAFHDNAGKVIERVQGWFGLGRADTNRAPAKTFTEDKATAIAESAKRLGMSPNDLATMISFETKGTFDPAIRNKRPGSTATGLIQFTEKTAKWLGTSTADLAKMSFTDQMAYVEKYFTQMGIGKNGKTSIADAYDAIMGVPKGGYDANNTKHKEAYAANKVWDVDGDGVIRPGEAVTGKDFQAHRANYFPAKTISMPPPFAPAYPAGMGVLKIPPAPKTQQQVGGKDAPIPVFIQGGTPDISQNVSDRNLAHAITGGLGMDYRGQ